METLTPTVTWLNLGNTTLSEIERRVRVHLYEVPSVVKFTEAGSRMVEEALWSWVQSFRSARRKVLEICVLSVNILSSPELYT